MRWRRRGSRGAIRTVVDGITFASKLEAGRYAELELLEMAGEIKIVELQPELLLAIEGKKVCIYIPDFHYRELKTGKEIMEDAKGFLESHTRIKIKLAQALFPQYEFRLWPERIRKKRKKGKLISGFGVLPKKSTNKPRN